MWQQEEEEQQEQQVRLHGSRGATGMQVVENTQIILDMNFSP